jgi:hypothetical protein
MYDFPPSSIGLFPTIVSPPKKATTSTNSQPIQMVTMSGSRLVDDGGKSYMPYLQMSTTNAAKQATLVLNGQGSPGEKSLQGYALAP